MMKIIILSFLAVIILLSCRNDGKSSSEIETQVNSVDTTYIDLDSADMQSISLSDYNLNLTLMVPIVATASGTEIEPEIEHVDGDYLWFINIGEHFRLVIEDYAKEFHKVLLHQKRLEEQKSVFTVTYLQKEPHLVFYKRELVDNNGGLPSYHCYAEIEVDGYNFVLRSETYGGYEQVIRDMVTSIKTAHPIVNQAQKKPL